MKKPKTYEEAIAQLEEILNRIADQSTPLEETLKLYAQAATVIEICNEKLQNAQLQIEDIQQSIKQKSRFEEVEVL